MKLRGYARAVALAGVFFATQSVAANITYTSGTVSYGGGSYTLSITTDGTLGALATSDYKQLTLTTTFSGVTTSAVTPDAGVYLQPIVGTSATATELKFDFANPDALLNLGSSNTGSSICFGGANHGCGAGTAPGEGFTNGTGSASESISTLTTIATAPGVPEPATWALMLIGFGGIGAMVRSSRKTLAAA